MKHGLILVAPSIKDQMDYAAKADKAGFDSVWVTEFFNQNGFVRLGAVAHATERCKVGTAIAYAFMRTPMLAASGAMDVDEISGGRVILGLGSGTKRMNEDWYSMPFEAAPAPRMRDAVGLIRAAFAAGKGGGLAYESENFNVKIPMYQRGHAVRDDIPIYVAGVNKGMVAMAAKHADGLVGHPIYTRKYIEEVVNPSLNGGKCQLAPYLICSIADDRETARNEARGQIAFYYTTSLYHTILDVHGWREIGQTISAAFKKFDFAAMNDAVTDDMIDAIAIAGTPDDVRDQIKQWDGLTDQVLLYPPSVGVKSARVRENLDAIIDTFGG
jgi:probable F420-dependent oxidoreductase